MVRGAKPVPKNTGRMTKEKTSKVNPLHYFKEVQVNT